MATPEESFDPNSPIGFNHKDQLKNLETFKSNLEKYFFAQVTIHDFSTEATSTKLVVELACDFGLAEMLHHLKLGTWGNFRSKKHNFLRFFESVKNSNDIEINIEEFTLYLKDTAITINKIYDNSIAEQLETILYAVKNHYIHFTKGLEEVPYEIYVPIFEENIIKKNDILKNVNSGNNNIQDYFKYWGLYFNNEDDAAVYDLNNNAVISGELQMLNWHS